MAILHFSYFPLRDPSLHTYICTTMYTPTIHMHTDIEVYMDTSALYGYISGNIFIGELGPYVNLECDGHVRKITGKKMYI